MIASDEFFKQLERELLTAREGTPDLATVESTLRR